MFSKFNEEARKVLIQSKKEMSDLKHPYIGSEHLLLAILHDQGYNLTKIFNRNGINYENFKNVLIDVVGIGKEKNSWYLYTPLLKRIIEEAIIISRENNEDEVCLEHLINAMFEEGEGVAIRILLCMNVNLDKLSKEFTIKRSTKKHKGGKKLLIEEYGYNMNESVKKNEIDPVIGRDKEIERIVEILCRRRKNNPLLLGDAGVGKTAIVEELSRQIVEGKVPNHLKDKKIISISMASLIAGTKYRGEFEERINKLLTEIEQNPEVIVFIDEIHTLVGAGGAEGAIDASNILKPFLARGKLKLIGATTIDEYKKYLEDDRALERRFQTLIVEEPSNENVIMILNKLKPIYESYHNVVIKEDVLKTIVELTDKYIYNRKQPDKAIDILDEACAKTSMTKDKRTIKLDELKFKLCEFKKQKNDAIIDQNFNLAATIKESEKKLEQEIANLEYKKMTGIKREVDKKTVAEIIKIKTNMPIFEIISEDLLQLKKIETTLNTKVIGQSEVINTISKDIKRIKLGYKDEEKPCSYLFVGPTGVGKTLLAKELSGIVNNSDKLIRLDMSEYKEEHTISKIIGSPPGYVGYSNKNTILDEIKLNPNAIILLDEIEKAHPSVINLFLQALDEGFIKSSNNDIIRMNNNIIIMTSNLGCKKNELGFCENRNNYVLDQLKEFLGIEFINRIDRVLLFNQLNEKDIKKIVKVKLDKMRKSFNLDTNQLHIKNNVVNQIIKESQYEQFGARRVDKIIKEKVYDIIIDEIIKENVNITIETV